MGDCLLDECVDVSRVEADRTLRAYRRMNSVLLSSRSYGRHFGSNEELDDSAILAQMYSLRSIILSVEDARERMFLYQYYIKGNSFDSCAKILGVSKRTVSRIKISALESVATKMKKSNV
jgi:DNA-directed RNA polymerase specialized sigma subunit